MRLFDSHLHIIDPAFSMRANEGFLPEPFSVAQYLDRVTSLDVAAGAVVSASFQGFDQRYLLAALERLGPTFVGVTQLPASASDAEIVRLSSAGVRGVRFNLRRGGSESIDRLETFAFRLHELVGWHVELYAGVSDLVELRPVLERLPAVSIDHLGLSAAGLPVLLQLVEVGVKVKATGFGRVDFDVRDILRGVHSVDPSALMFGTDLPSTRARRPFDDHDVDLILETLGESEANRVLWGNASAFYRLERTPSV